MADRGDDRGGFDDLFEDLDKFFSPEDRTESGSGAVRRDPDRERAAASGEGQGRGPDAGGSNAGEGSDEGAAAAGSEDEILPADWLPDIDDLDLGEGVEPGSGGEPLAAEKSPALDEPPADEPAATPEPPPRPPAADAPGRPEDRGAAPGGDRPLSTAGEMSQQDWSRLREVLGDESGPQDEEVALPPEPDVGPTADMFDDEEDEGPLFPGEERHELTLDDLKKAPAEYRHLPRSEDEAVEAEAAQDDRDAVREDRGAFLGEREGVRDDFADLGERPLVPESTSDEWARPPSDDWDEPTHEAGSPWGEPAIAEVEAAAEQMAEEFRSELPAEDELLADIRRPGGRRTVKVGEPESLTGPAWEEPGSQVVTTEPPGAVFAGRNMPMALLTAAVLAVLALVSIAIDKAFFAFVVGGVVLIGQAEVYAAMQRKGYQPATALGLVLGGLLLAAAYLKGEQAMLFFVGLGVVLSFLWYIVAAPKASEGALGNIGATMLGLIYVPLLAGFLLLILAQPLSGRALTLAILGLTFLYDAAAFVIGSLWGSRALAPSISPKKSWEGLLAATFVTFIVSIAALPSIEPLTLGRSVGLALIVAVFAPLGDLAESLLKRDLGVKDMGSVLPGHGGIMDRIDSALFVIPAAFYFLRLVL